MLRSAYDLNHRLKPLKLGRLDAARALVAGASHRAAGRPRHVGLRLAGDDRPLYIRPFTSDLDVLLSLMCHGEYDAVRPHLKSVGSVVDLGANIGVSARLWSRWFPDARIVAVEPDAENAALARRNTGHLPQVTLITGAIADEAGTLQLDRSGEPWAFRTTASPGGGTVAVPAITMEQVLERIGGDRVDLLKCDVEGAEAALFGSRRAWVRAVRFLLVETHRPYDMAALQADLAAAGSPLRLVYANVQSPDNVVGFFAS